MATVGKLILRFMGDSRRQKRFPRREGDTSLLQNIPRSPKMNWRAKGSLGYWTLSRAKSLQQKSDGFSSRKPIALFAGHETRQKLRLLASATQA
jgi:hypothetical protein